eukprot:TRINITY_DN12899_c0_g1_i10.p1 TRINITY_DN12899_c0_g1~~TRINITY_DN12899_c0_g1_i10.p1  ORF type:complete len:244 (+),score=44.12 TRINITY_DN12899_c0_g1_i10:156-887(+)
MRDKKKAVTIESLCKGLPKEFDYFLHYCRSLKFEEEPDYRMLKKMFSDLFSRKGYDRKFDYDWNILKLDLDLLLERDYDDTRSKEASKEDRREKEAKPIHGTQKKEDNILAKYASTPDNLKSPFRKPRKLPAFLITKKVKQMKQQFLAMMRRNESQEEIPDENIGSLNKVRAFINVDNYVHWTNKKNKHKMKERKLTWDCASSIVVHRNVTSENVYSTIRSKHTMTPGPTRRNMDAKRRIKNY